MTMEMEELSGKEDPSNVLYSEGGQVNKCDGILQNFSLAVISTLEGFFDALGCRIAQSPWGFILTCCLVTMLCSLGLMGFTPENRPDKLWIPWNSQFVQDSDWLRDNFPSPIRFHYAILTAPNVLDTEGLKILLDIHEKVTALTTTDLKRWNDICFRLPVTKFTSSEMDGFEANEASPENHSVIIDKFQFDPSFTIGQETYCDLLSALDQECWESNLAELWKFDNSSISSVTLDDILLKINSKTYSPVFGRTVNYITELGGVTRNSSNHIIGARAIMVRWFAKINQTTLQQETTKEYDLGTGELVDRDNLMWEKELASLLNSYILPNDEMKLYFNVARSFGDISGATTWDDANMLSVGFSIVFVYVIFMLGKFNMVEQRPLLSLIGFVSVAFAILVSYGICSAFKIIYSPVHNILPLLLLGLGIDDIFIIVQCWNNLNDHRKNDNQNLTTAKRMGLTLKHAGVSITVTSLTDFFAFAIGATTTLPALQSFCIYAAVGILATYVFQATFFVAWFAIDQKRLESYHNAFVPCYRHDDFVPSPCSQNSYIQIFLDKIYCRFLFRKSWKIAVLFVTLIILGINIWGNLELRQEFNPIWFLPQDSYLFKYFVARDKYFSDRGDEGFILLHNISYPEGLRHLEILSKDLTEFPHIHEIDSWYMEFRSYILHNFMKDLSVNNLTESQFHKYMGRFLFSPSGSKFRGRIRVNGELNCGLPSPSILISSIGFKFKRFNGPAEHIPVMNRLKEIVKKFQDITTTLDSNYREEGRAFVWSFAFAGWETDEIITAELYRNMALAMVCVILTTLLLIANLKTGLMVFACVIFTLLNVAGTMHFWGLTIDTVSCINLVLAIGLAVDYSTHIGLAFMTSTGSRNARAKNALVDIGPAVLNGGFTTFLAFILLANSKSHVFITFFKIFSLVVLYGLYHGLVFLPVLLSFIGPEPYPTCTTEKNSKQMVPLKRLAIDID